MRDADAALPIRLDDYRPPAWRVRTVALVFDLDPDATEVEATLQLEPDPAQQACLRLDGEELELLSIALDGRALDPAQYRHDSTGLSLPEVREACVLRTRVRIHPRRNTRLEGLYASGNSLLTQCEAEGFRRITFFIDRPDVSARYDVLLRAERARFPILLSNGNPAAAGELDDGRHWARWIDPHPKPCYLFALVAGDLARLHDTFVTAEGRAVEVSVWAAPTDVARCRHALESALRAMRWDEQRFGRCYDLDRFNIVATHDFTMGAMENKGLNIFNARYLLADPDSATDSDYEAVESVIGHEYFHNWSGNRVTLRDWFQLSLKEGLTVFRDQEFTSDLRSRALKRIEDVRLLKSRQFVEDAGPLRHPVRPRVYREINNFYTATVYEKGAELVRMLHTLLGETTFRAGLDAYFTRHDGGAATIEDFLAAMAAASGRDLTRFARWYDHAGTPQLQVDTRFDPAAAEFTLTIEQRDADGRLLDDERALQIPLAFALYDGDGRSLAPASAAPELLRPGLIELQAPRTTLRFPRLHGAPLPAFLQGLSAPVRLDAHYDASALARLVRCEPDPLTRWEATQTLAAHAIIAVGPAQHEARDALVEVLGMLLDRDEADPGFVAECHQLPDIATLADQCARIDVDQLLRQREDLLELLAETHVERYLRHYEALADAGAARFDPATIARRRLRTLCLARLARLEPEGARASAHYAAACTLTDRLAALTALLHHDAPNAEAALADFRGRWGGDALVDDKWLSLLLTRPRPDTVERLDAVLAGPLWRPSNPNRVRAVLGSFVRNNAVAFHRRDGAGYARFFSLVPALDALNPQVAARQLGAIEYWTRLDEVRRGRIAAHLDALAAQALSRDCSDVVLRLRHGADA